MARETARGYVYVLKNPAMPGILKIGHTTRSPQLRCNEISNATGVPVDFEIAYVAEVAGSKAAEKWVHQQLGPLRCNNKREFFKLGLREARKIVEVAADKFPVRAAPPTQSSPLKRFTKGACSFVFKLLLFSLWEVCAIGLAAYWSTNFSLVEDEDLKSLLFLFFVLLFSFFPLLVSAKRNNNKAQVGPL